MLIKKNVYVQNKHRKQNQNKVKEAKTVEALNTNQF